VIRDCRFIRELRNRRAIRAVSQYLIRKEYMDRTIYGGPYIAFMDYEEPLRPKEQWDSVH